MILSSLLSAALCVESAELLDHFRCARDSEINDSVDLDATKLGRDAGKIAEEVVQHLSSLVGSNVELTLEIRADVPDGVPDNVVRTVTENCRTLKFKNIGFEEK